MGYRVETDSLGEVQVPEDALWGAQTQRSIGFFSNGRDHMPTAMRSAFAIVKQACAYANWQQQALSQEKYDLIQEVCTEIIAGEHDDQFPLYVWMTGSGTQFNMNVNELIANRSAQKVGQPLGGKKPVHPNDDVNRSQSSNDVFPTAMYIATAMLMEHKLKPALTTCIEHLQQKASQWQQVVKIGRTHMQDAVPMTLGQEFEAFAVLLRGHQQRLDTALQEVLQLPLGGTAVGTGLNASPAFIKQAVQHIADFTQLPFKEADNKFAVMGSHDALLYVASLLRMLAATLYKMANDIRLLSSGPRAGIGELILPENEPGSSIMPGKVNPTQCEALAMIAAQVMGTDVAMSFANAGGILQMNVYKPMMIFNLSQSIDTLSDGMCNFSHHLLAGMQPDEKTTAHNVQQSLMLVTALSPTIGYDKASQLAHYAHHHDCSLREANDELKFLSTAEFDKLIDPMKMACPHQ